VTLVRAITGLVGPMPTQQFLNEFFPTTDLPGLDSVPFFGCGCYDAAVIVKKEHSAYKPFVSHFNELVIFLFMMHILRSKRPINSLLAFILSIHLIIQAPNQPLLSFEWA
jgi:hypothetical protein